MSICPGQKRNGEVPLCLPSEPSISLSAGPRHKPFKGVNLIADLEVGLWAIDEDIPSLSAGGYNCHT